MDNEQLFNILEKLLDELDYYTMVMQGDTEYCKEVRKQVFTEDCQLTFDVVAK